MAGGWMEGAGWRAIGLDGGGGWSWMEAALDGGDRWMRQ